jgi:capsular polysaccharide biosynthesis protein/Mrp family chromosome partitioning ATPase
MTETSTPANQNETPQPGLPYGHISFWWNNLTYLVREQFWILIVVVVVVMGLDFLVFKLSTRVYASKGTFVVDQSPFQFTGTGSGGTGTEDDSRLLLQSIISGIQSEDMREIIADRLNVAPRNISFLGFDTKIQSLSEPDTVNIDASSERTSRVAIIEADASDPEFAAKAANAVLDELSGLNRLAGRIDSMNEQIKVVQDKVDAYATSESGFEADRVALEQKMLGLKQHLAAGGSLSSSPAFSDDPGLLELIKKKIDADSAYHAQAQVSVRGEQLTALEGQEDSVNDQIDAYLADRKIGLDSAYQEATQKVAALQASVKAQTDLLTDLGNQKATLIKAIGDFKLRRKLGIFDDNSPDQEAGVIVVLDRAHAPLKPSKPNVLLDAAIGIFLCVVLAPPLMFLRHSLDQRIRSPLQIEWSAGVHCLAVLAQSSHKAEIKANPDQLEKEAYAGLTFLRNQLLRESVIGAQNQIIAFTDVGRSQAGEWVARLGWLMAQADKPTLLVDLDLQRPTLSQALNIPPGPGLYEWVKSSEPLSHFVSKTKVSNLGLIQPGAHSADLDTFLSRRPLAPHLTELAKDWPFIFIYAPSLVRAPNLLLAAPHDCPVVSLVHFNKSTMTELQEEISQCDSYHFRFAGVVLHHYPLKGSHRNKSRIGSHHYIYELKNRAATT